MQAGEREHALDRAVRALARRDHSAQSLRGKLERAGFSAEARDEAVETLAQAGYLDDERFARDRAERLAERGLGDAVIRADLERQGVKAEVAERAIATLEPERERAAGSVVGLGGGLRAARVLARKGFSAESIEHTVPDAVADGP